MYNHSTSSCHQSFSLFFLNIEELNLLLWQYLNCVLPTRTLSCGICPHWWCFCDCVIEIVQLTQNQCLYIFSFPLSFTKKHVCTCVCTCAMDSLDTVHKYSFQIKGFSTECKALEYILTYYLWLTLDYNIKKQLFQL